jgi:hypothetical protein
MPVWIFWIFSFLRVSSDFLAVELGAAVSAIVLLYLLRH